jgi:FkbM family methyltransferase
MGSGLRSLYGRYSKALRSYAVFGASRSPGFIRFAGTGRLYLNPSDNRGKAIHSSFGMTQPRITLIWKLLAKHLHPDIVLDIGANHGEIALSTHYESEASIYLFEPNPFLSPFLEKSIRSHRNWRQISLHPCLVSDTETEQTFYVDRKWSGTSSGIGRISDPKNSFKGEGEELFDAITIKSVRIDDILSKEDVCEKTILFKIDVEGYESKVIAGMLSLLRASKGFSGIMEFDQTYLRRANCDPNLFLSSLQELSKALFLVGKSLTRVTDASAIPERADLLICSTESYLSALKIPRMARLFYPWI